MSAESNINVESSLKVLFSHRFIGPQVDRAYHDHIYNGRNRSRESFTKIEKRISRAAIVNEDFVIPGMTHGVSPGIAASILTITSQATIHPTLTSSNSRLALMGSSSRLFIEQDDQDDNWNYGEIGQAGVPTGFEPFIQTDHLFIVKTSDTMELPTPVADIANYDVLNSNGERIYYARQLPRSRNWCSKLFGYPYTFVLLTFNSVEILRFEGEPKGSCGVKASLQVQTKWERFGAVTKKTSSDEIFSHKGDGFLIGDGKDNPIFGLKRIGTKGADYEVFAVDGENVLIGRISTKWGNHLKGRSNQEDIFGVNFTKALDVKKKALLLGALIMLEYRLFDKMPS